MRNSKKKKKVTQRFLSCKPVVAKHFRQQFSNKNRCGNHTTVSYNKTVVEFSPILFPPFSTLQKFKFPPISTHPKILFPHLFLFFPIFYSPFFLFSQISISPIFLNSPQILISLHFKYFFLNFVHNQTTVY